MTPCEVCGSRGSPYSRRLYYATEAPTDDTRMELCASCAASWEMFKASLFVDVRGARRRRIFRVFPIEARTRWFIVWAAWRLIDLETLAHKWRLRGELRAVFGR